LQRGIHGGFERHRWGRRNNKHFTNILQDFHYHLQELDYK
jgi:hypothetical protein